MGYLIGGAGDASAMQTCTSIYKDLDFSQCLYKKTITCHNTNGITIEEAKRNYESRI